jgi:acyl carrier protein
VSPEQIEATMRRLVADCLAVDAEQVRRESRLTDELGADSLDFIDLLFVIEKEFGIKVRDSELDFLSRLDFSSPEVMREGHLTAATLDRLRGFLPLLRDVPDPGRVTPAQLFAMITVETLCILVGRKLAAA